jgi:hypothetical protein
MACAQAPQAKNGEQLSFSSLSLDWEFAVVAISSLQLSTTQQGTTVPAVMIINNKTTSAFTFQR